MVLLVGRGSMKHTGGALVELSFCHSSRRRWIAFGFAWRIMKWYWALSSGYFSDKVWAPLKLALCAARGVSSAFIDDDLF